MIKINRTLLYSIVSGIIGTSLVILYVFRLESRFNDENRGNYGNSTANVVIAMKDIPADTTITEDMVAVKEFNEKAARPMALSYKEEAVGKSSNEEILKGSQLTAGQIKERKTRLASLIPGKGLRAISLPLIGVNGLSGMLEPGNYVDILATFNENNMPQFPGPVVYTLLQNVQVLALDRSSSNNSEKGEYSSVIVAVTPEESEILSLAINSGITITLTLRPNEDNEIVDIKRKTLKELYEIKQDINIARKEILIPIEEIRSTEKRIEKTR